MGATVELEGVLDMGDGASSLWLPYENAARREPNLSCHDKSGAKLWDAEEVQSLDKWVSICIEDGRILANSSGGYLCELDPKSGRIMTSTFVK